MFLFAKAPGPFFSKQTVIIIVFANQVESHHVCMGKKIQPEIAGPILMIQICCRRMFLTKNGLLMTQAQLFRFN